MGPHAPGSPLHLDALKGMIAAARRAKAVLDLRRLTPGAHTPDPAGSPLSRLGGAGQHLSYLAGTNASAFIATVASLPTLHAAALAELKSLEEHTSHQADRLRLAYAIQILHSAAPPLT